MPRRGGQCLERTRSIAEGGQTRTEDSPLERDPSRHGHENRLGEEEPDGPSQARLHHLADAPALKIVPRHVPRVARLFAELGGLAREEDGRARFLEEEREADGKGGGHGEHDPVDGAETLLLHEVAEHDGTETRGCARGGTGSVSLGGGTRARK